MYPYGNKQADKFFSASILKGRWNYAYTDGHKYTNAILRYLVKINSYKHIFGIERPLCKVDEYPYSD
jgi:hypothetical protein